MFHVYCVSCEEKQPVRVSKSGMIVTLGDKKTIVASTRVVFQEDKSTSNRADLATLLWTLCNIAASSGWEHFSWVIHIRPCNMSFGKTDDGNLYIERIFNNGMGWRSKPTENGMWKTSQERDVANCDLVQPIVVLKELMRLYSKKSITIEKDSTDQDEVLLKQALSVANLQTIITNTPDTSSMFSSTAKVTVWNAPSTPQKNDADGLFTIYHKVPLQDVEDKAYWIQLLFMFVKAPISLGLDCQSKIQPNLQTNLTLESNIGRYYTMDDLLPPMDVDTNLTQAHVNTNVSCLQQELKVPTCFASNKDSDNTSMVSRDKGQKEIYVLLGVTLVPDPHNGYIATDTQTFLQPTPDLSNESTHSIMNWVQQHIIIH